MKLCLKLTAAIKIEENIENKRLSLSLDPSHPIVSAVLYSEVVAVDWDTGRGCSLLCSCKMGWVGGRAFLSLVRKASAELSLQGEWC